MGPQDSPLQPHEVAHEGAHYRLRHYRSPRRGATPPVLLVPPLMVTAEIYDVSPELSAVAHLVAGGLDVWGVDFGAPEHQAGGLERTLDDHLLAVDDAVDEVARRTGQPVHLVGYSQGGLFVYQVAAYRRSRQLASLVTMGSPVDMRRNLPVPVHGDLVERTTRVARDLLQQPLALIDGLPGELTSLGFKLLSLRKEVEQYGQLLALLPDRDAVARWRSRRQFLGGGGFVAWPGPALRTFIDEVLASNRLTSGGFVINGRIVSLSDIHCPVLCFVGRRDDLAYPPAVRAIRRVAPHAPVQVVEVSTGHFGLVVGSAALGVTWPTVVDWAQHSGRLEARPPPDRRARRAAAPRPAPPLVRSAWQRLGELSLELAGLVDVARWERPRLARLSAVHTRLAFGPGYALARTAAESPTETFFLWRGRAYSHAAAHEHVLGLAARLRAAGVRPGQRVALRLETEHGADALSALCAVSTLGAEICPVDGASPPLQPVDHGVEVINDLPHTSEPLPTEGRRPAPTDPALDLRSAAHPEPTHRLANRDWAAAALHTAAVCRLRPSDTLYCALPLADPLALLCAFPPSLIARTRLALGQPTADSQALWDDLRRTGASVVFLSAAAATALAEAPGLESPHENAIRCLVLPAAASAAAEPLRRRFRVGQVITARFAPGRPDAPSPLELTPTQ